MKRILFILLAAVIGCKPCSCPAKESDEISVNPVPKIDSTDPWVIGYNKSKDDYVNSVLSSEKMRFTQWHTIGLSKYTLKYNSFKIEIFVEGRSIMIFLEKKNGDTLIIDGNTPGNKVSTETWNKIVTLCLKHTKS